MSNANAALNSVTALIKKVAIESVAIENVDDAFQTACLAFLEAYHGYDSDKSKLTTWAAIVARSAIRKMHRKETTQSRSGGVQFDVDDRGVMLEPVGIERNALKRDARYVYSNREQVAEHFESGFASSRQLMTEAIGPFRNPAYIAQQLELLEIAQDRIETRLSARQKALLVDVYCNGHSMSAAGASQGITKQAAAKAIPTAIALLAN